MTNLKGLLGCVRSDTVATSDQSRDSFLSAFPESNCTRTV
jgi:hypothetical protein